MQLDVQTIATREPKSAARVLLVDDDPTLLSALVYVLEREGYTVLAYPSGKAACSAIEALEPGGFDAVVTDFAMPGADGLEVMHRVHQLDPTIPVLLMTGVPSLETAVKALERGAFKFLTKPIEPVDLVGAVQRALHSRAASVRGSALERSGEPLSTARARTEQALVFHSALDQLWMAFQPIVDGHSHEILAYEALVRSDEPRLGRPDQLLAAAEHLGGLHALGRKIRAFVGDAIASAPADCSIFVNLHSADLADEELYSPTGPLAPHAARIVFEVTERVSLSRLSDVDARVSALRALGYRIAVDDLGAGYAALSSITQLRPEIVKLDMSLIRDVDTDEMKQRLVAAMGALCRSLNITMVAEGVETASERDALLSVSGLLMQGYLYARPGRGFVGLNPQSRKS
jgi:EAL domain-containing protein (putative c-di-GMP-specific phosphodiesterase class I)/CheY-like chemotaxis protein